ncbi:MAG: hypothetical protein JWO31_2003 [Phycisphaerales bacterium]|nr:hypothetical protein [Phycisphaerales bacterium]
MTESREGVKLKKQLFAVAALCGLASQARATALLNDGFTYSDGAIETVSAGAWTIHSAGATPLSITSNKAVINQGDTGSGKADANRLFNGGTTYDPTTDNTSILYSSFTVNFSALPVAGDSDGSYFAHFKTNGASQFYGRVSATTNGAAAGAFRVGITGASSTVANTIEFPLDLALNTDYTVVTRLDLSTDKATLWINPTTEASTSVTSVDVIPYAGLLNSYALRQGVSGTGAPGVLTVDNLAVATTFAEVVPEPGSLSLAAVGALGLVRRRRHR